MIYINSRGDEMMLVVVPNMLLNRAFNLRIIYLPENCFPSMIWEVTNLTSEVCKGILDGFRREVNKFNQHILFTGRRG